MFALGTFLFVKMVTKHPRNPKHIQEGERKVGAGEFRWKNIVNLDLDPKLILEDLLKPLLALKAETHLALARH